MIEKNAVLVIFLMVLLNAFDCNCEEVSSKLDFDESEGNSGDSATGKMAAKIQGVRVVVDTMKQGGELTVDAEDKSSGSNSKKTVGIRTDITFEIIEGDNKNNTNSTNTNGQGGGDDEEVPIFKGTKKETSGGTLWKYDDIPIFHKTDDEQFNHGGAYGWSNFIPSTSGVWTTERNSILRRKDSHGFRGVYRPPYTGNNKPWKPCLCQEQQQWRGFNAPTSIVNTHHRVDDKIDDPFSSA